MPERVIKENQKASLPPACKTCCLTTCSLEPILRNNLLKSTP